MRAEATWTAGAVILAAVVWTVLLVGRGVLLIDQHPADALHVADILTRMAAGERPHLDFMTPIGAAMFWPAALFNGQGLGHSILYGQVLFLWLMAPLIWWVAANRLPQFAAFALAVTAVAIIGAVIYGGTHGQLSVSMYYNRWAWAVATLVVVMILVDPPDGTRQLVDGLVLGLLMSVLALGKATFFVALLPAVVAALVLRGHFITAAMALVTGAAAALLATMQAGDPAFLWDYADDLMAVSEGGTRPYATAPLSDIVLGARHLPANLLLVVAVIALRAADQARAAAVLLIAAPGLLFVAFQNWGNDPIWLLALGFALIGAGNAAEATRPARGAATGPLVLVALAALALIAPVMANLAVSPVQQVLTPVAGFSAVLADDQAGDFRIRTRLAQEVRTNRGEADADPLTVAGRTYPDCRIERGYSAIMQRIAGALVEDGRTTGKSVFVADSISPLHLYGPTVPVRGGAPWYYGGTETLRRADFVLVPVCAISTRARNIAVRAIEADADLALVELSATPDFVLYTLSR